MKFLIVFFLVSVTQTVYADPKCNLNASLKLVSPTGTVVKQVFGETDLDPVSEDGWLNIRLPFPELFRENVFPRSVEYRHDLRLSLGKKNLSGYPTIANLGIVSQLEGFDFYLAPNLRVHSLPISLNTEKETGFLNFEIDLGNHSTKSDTKMTLVGNLFCREIISKKRPADQISTDPLADNTSVDSAGSDAEDAAKEFELDANFTKNIIHSGFYFINRGLDVSKHTTRRQVLERLPDEFPLRKEGSNREATFSKMSAGCRVSSLHDMLSFTECVGCASLNEVLKKLAIQVAKANLNQSCSKRRRLTHVQFVQTGMVDVEATLSELQDHLCKAEAEEIKYLKAQKMAELLDRRSIRAEILTYLNQLNRNLSVVEQRALAREAGVSLGVVSPILSKSSERNALIISSTNSRKVLDALKKLFPLPDFQEEIANIGRY